MATKHAHQIDSNKKYRIERRTMTEFSERLHEALDDAGFPGRNKGRQQKFADAIQLSQSGVSRWLGGRGLPRPKQQELLASFLNVRIEWLMYNLGPKRKPDGAARFDSEFMQRIMLTLDDALLSAKVPVTDKQKAKMVTLLYEGLKSAE
jgi:transcriptional regulator with XRE-family HTH domain